MKMKSLRYLRCCAPRGFTLVEVTVSIALLASLLVSCLLALSALERKNALARRRLTAHAAADSIAAAILANAAPLSTPSGEVADNPTLRWTTTQRPLNVEGVNGEVLRLDIFDAETSQSFATVELLVSHPGLATAPAPLGKVRPPQP